MRAGAIFFRHVVQDLSPLVQKIRRAVEVDPGVRALLVSRVLELEPVVHEDALREAHLLVGVHFILSALGDVRTQARAVVRVDTAITS